MTVEEVIEEHKELLFGLMARGDHRNADTFRPVVMVLDVYAGQMSAVDCIIHQPHVEQKVLAAR